MKDYLPMQRTASAEAAVKRDVHLGCLWLKEWRRQKSYFSKRRGGAVKKKLLKR